MSSPSPSRKSSSKAERQLALLCLAIEEGRSLEELRAMIRDCDIAWAYENKIVEAAKLEGYKEAVALFNK